MAKGKFSKPGEGSAFSEGRLYAPDEIEFQEAVEAFQQRTGKKFPTWAEVLGVVKALGYRKEPVKPCQGSGARGQEPGR